MTHALQSNSPAMEKGNTVTPAGGNTNACAMTDQRGYARPADGDANGGALCDIGAYEFRATPTLTITYTYDPLYRLTNAAYSDGSVYTNTYDAVGNRLTQTVFTATTTYTYDAANRMTQAGASPYTWDNNGNQLTDAGIYTYTYNAANQLITTTQGANTWVYKYNGQGDRVQQIFNGTITTYTVDLAASLPQVLVGVGGGVTTTYLYGDPTISSGPGARIAQQVGATTSYYLNDGLGSVRQLVNANDTVTLLRSHQPYGPTVSTAGSSGSSYDFTGEWRDTSGLLYLRARYYRPGIVRFIQKDTWAGSYNNPLTLNGFAYVQDNPTNFTDPSGLICIFGYGNCDQEQDIGAEIASLPWKLLPKDFCLPGNMGCWGGQQYANYLQKEYYPQLPKQVDWTLHHPAQAWGLPASSLKTLMIEDWFLEQGPEPRAFHEYDPATQLLKRHAGVNQARGVFYAGGCRSMTGVNKYHFGVEGRNRFEHAYNLVSANLVLVSQAILVGSLSSLV